jgi:hypothetical protein
MVGLLTGDDTEIEFTPCDSHHLMAHNLTLQVGIAVVLPGPIMEI